MTSLRAANSRQLIGRDPCVIVCKFAKSSRFSMKFSSVESGNGCKWVEIELLSEGNLRLRGNEEEEEVSEGF